MTTTTTTVDGGRRLGDGRQRRQAVGNNQPTNRQVGGGFNDGWEANDGYDNNHCELSCAS